MKTKLIYYLFIYCCYTWKLSLERDKTFFFIFYNLHHIKPPPLTPYVWNTFNFFHFIYFSFNLLDYTLTGEHKS